MGIDMDMNINIDMGTEMVFEIFLPEVWMLYHDDMCA